MRSRPLYWLAILFIIIGTIIAGCDPRRTASTAVGAVAATEKAAVTVAGEEVQSAATVPVNEPSAAPNSTVTASPSNIVLTWWTPPWFFPHDDEESGRIVQKFVHDFEMAYQGIVVESIAKLPYGKGGILDFLTTTSHVAPDVLPDLVSIDLDELPAAVRLGLVQPIGSLMPLELVNDLFPFTVQAAQIEGEWLALPFTADVEHLVYDTSRVQDPPSTWDEFLSDDFPWLFAVDAGDGRVGDAVLIQYLGAGGTFQKNQPGGMLDGEALTLLLQFYESSREAGLVPPQVLSLSKADTVWSFYSSSEVPMIEAQAQRYLAERNNLSGSGYAQIPTGDGRTVTLGRGWGLVVTATDPDRQQAAMQFITWMLDPVRSGAWTQAAGRLPTRRAALDEWGTGDPYFVFLREQLEAARYLLREMDYEEARRILRQATIEVLTGTASPEEAVARALQEGSP